MIKSFLNISILLIIAYLLFLILIFFNQKKLIYYPSFEIDVDPSLNDINFEDIYLKINNKPNEYIHCWFLPVEKSLNTIIFCHGNGGNISHRLDTISLIVNELKCSLLIFDYRGYGKSLGQLSEHNTYEDAETVWNYILNEKNIKPDSIIIWGRSLGGAVGINLALKNTPKALIVESTFSSIPDMATHLYPYLPAKIICKEKYDSFNKINAINCPKLFIHSKDDEIIPFDLGLKLYNNSKQPKTFVEIKGNHNNGFMDSKEEYLNAIYNFLINL